MYIIKDTQMYAKVPKYFFLNIFFLNMGYLSKIKDIVYFKDYIYMYINSLLCMYIYICMHTHI